MVTGHGDETLGGSLWTYEILFGQYLRKLGATGDGMGPQGNGPGVSVLTPPGGIGPGGKGGVGYWSGRGATPETAVQLKGVTVTAMRIRGFSLAEMYAHFQIGGGEEMVIDMATIDFNGTTQRELGIDGMIAGEDREVNLFNAGSLNPSALAFGRVRMKYHGNNQFSILTGEGANFNFSPLIDPQASLARNAGNVLGALINYNIFISPFSRILPFVPLLFGGGYDVGFVGTTYISR